MGIGLLLREARKEQGLKAEDLAERLSVATPTITRWENGTIDIKASDIERYCEAIGITLDRLYQGVDKSIAIIAKGDDAIQQQVGRATRQSATFRLPILGTIRAGVPILAQESYEGYLEVPDYIRADFVLQVTGDSMIGAGILDGDYAVCRQAQDANSGQIVVALKDQSTGFSEATLKYYVSNGNGSTLRAANPNYPEINMKDGYRISGLAVGLIRKDMPPLHLYQDYLTVAGHEDWTEVIELASSAGIKPDHLKSHIDMLIEMGKRK